MSNNAEKRGALAVAKRTGISALKIGLAAALITWQVKSKRLDPAPLIHLDFDARCTALLAAGLVSVGVGVLLLGWRLKLLMNFQRFDLSLKQAVNLTFIGSFFGTVLPGMVGGDVVKAVYLCGGAGKRRISIVSAVLMDRVLGTYALFSLGTIALIAAWAADSLNADTTLLMASPIIVAVLTIGALLVASDRCFNSAGVQKACSACPNLVRNLIFSLRSYLVSPRLVVLALLVSVLNHALVVTSYVIAAFLLRDKLSVSDYFVISPLAMVMNMVPLTPGGLGITESAFSFLFRAAGSSNGALVGLLGRFIQYVVFALGGVVGLLSAKFGVQIQYADSERSKDVVETGAL